MTILAQLQRLIMPTPKQSYVQSLYIATVEQAREVDFYAKMGVPDTIDGRFEMIALHLALVLFHLTADNQRLLMEACIADMDRSLREMGAGDTGVGRRVQSMVSGFYGRQAVYAHAGENEEIWIDALRRNVYGTVTYVKEETLAALAQYAIASAKTLAHMDKQAWETACLSFASL